MTRRAVFVSAIAALALFIGGCGSHADDATAKLREKSGRRPDFSRKTTTTTVPPPYSFDGSVPPPPLINTGTDYEAIYRSLSAYARWAESHDPNPGVGDEVYVKGTETYDGYVRDLQVLEHNELRLVNVDERLRASVVSVKSGLVSLRLWEHLGAMQLIDRGGRIRDERGFTSDLNWTAVITQDAQGRWQIASVDPADEATRVQL
jgi:hypothetical protein